MTYNSNRIKGELKHFNKEDLLNIVGREIDAILIDGEAEIARNYYEHHNYTKQEAQAYLMKYLVDYYGTINMTKIYRLCNTNYVK